MDSFANPSDHSNEDHDFDSYMSTTHQGLEIYQNNMKDRNDQEDRKDRKDRKNKKDRKDKKNRDLSSFVNTSDRECAQHILMERSSRELCSMRGYSSPNRHDHSNEDHDFDSYGNTIHQNDKERYRDNDRKDRKDSEDDLDDRHDEKRALPEISKIDKKKLKHKTKLPSPLSLALQSRYE